MKYQIYFNKQNPQKNTCILVHLGFLGVHGLIEDIGPPNCLHYPIWGGRWIIYTMCEQT